MKYGGGYFLSTYCFHIWRNCTEEKREEHIGQGKGLEDLLRKQYGISSGVKHRVT